MTTPQRHVAHIINTATGLDVDTPTGRDAASVRRCPRCRALTLVGLDDTIAARPATVDPSALTRSDEAAALLSGRATYHLRRDPARNRWLIRSRDRWQIAGRPADTTLVVAEHACGQPLGAPIDLRPVPPVPPSEGAPF